MSNRHPFDADDPFGTRPDEKPPQGWDASFWEGVRERIEDRRLESPDAVALDDHETAGSSRTSPLTLLTWALFAAFCTAVLFGGGTSPDKQTARADPASSVVRVSGAQAASVDVEWASAGGNRSGFVVLQDADPDVSYVVLAGGPIRPAAAP